MQERYWEDFEPGDVFVSRGVTLTESQIIDFALAFDPQPFHIDREAAVDGPFGGLAASGFHTLCLGFRIFYQEGIINHCSLGSPGFDELRWMRPVRPDDTLHTEARVEEKRPSSSKPDRGTLRMAYTIKNQRGEPVTSFLAIHIFRRRPAAAEHS